MPTLDWIGQKAVVNHHRQVPYRLLRCDGKLSVTPSPSQGEGRGEGWRNSTNNLLVQSDNLLTPKAPLSYYVWEITGTCMDPPYDSGK
jgi:hypothetical protein